MDGSIKKLGTALCVVVLCFSSAYALNYWIETRRTKERNQLIKAIMKKIQSGSLEDRAIGLIIGTGVGDAKGIPYENKTFEQIKEMVKPNEIYSYCKRDNFGPGKWTDDTQLTLAMARALTQASEMDMECMVKEHIKEYKRRLRGWGGTKDAIKRLVDGTHTHETSGNLAIGNGVLMKLAPLAFFYAQLNPPLSKEEKIKQVTILSKMTHTTPVAVLTACLFAYMAEQIFRNPQILDSLNSKKEFLTESIDLAKELEQNLIPPEEIPHQSTTKISPRLLELLKALDTKISDQDLIAISEGGTYFCVNSLTMVVGLLVKDGLKFDTILSAALIGGDTDSNAAIVGAIVGGVKGVHHIPEEYILPLEKNDELFQTGEAFAKMLQSLSTKST